MTAPAIIAVVALAAVVAIQVFGLWTTAQQVRRTYRGQMARRMFVRAGWPHAVNVVGMILWVLLLGWGGFWS